MSTTITDAQRKNMISRIKSLKATATLLYNEANILERELAGVHPLGNSLTPEISDEEKAKRTAQMYKRRKIPFDNSTTV